MEAREMDRMELQVQVSTTPLKPILPKPVPICAPGEGNQLDRHVNGEVACFEFSNGKEVNSRQHLQSAPAATAADIAGDNAKTCVQTASENLHRSSYAEFAQLLKSHFVGDPVTNPTNTLPTHHHLSLEQRSIIRDNSQDPQGTSYQTTSYVAPPTPDNAIRAERREVTAMQINMDGGDLGEEEKKVPAKNSDNNGTPHNKELCDPVIEFDAVSTPFKENHNPAKGSGHDTELNRTPQPKPRRRKHRPKVITEGKPKRTRKAVTPKPVQSKENPVKRKYVRRKGLNKTSTPPTEVTVELNKPMMPKSGRKSCRRSLNFDIGARDERSACHEHATVNLGKEIGEVIEETNVGLVYDQNSSMRQASNDYASLAVDAQAPNTPLPQSNPPGTKPEENPAGKRKYVRVKRLNKTSTPPTDVIGLTKPMMPETTDKACRRSVNFDIGERDETSVCRKDASELLGKEIGVVVVETHAGLAYDLYSSMKQALNNYMSTADTQTPSTSLSKSNPLEAKPKENPTGKRKYVRRKGVNRTSTPPTEVTEELIKPMMPESAKKSCRRSTNFDRGARDESSMCQENSTVHPGKEISVAEEMHWGPSYDLNALRKQDLNDYMSLPEEIKAQSTFLSNGNPPGAKPNDKSAENNSKRKFPTTAQVGHENSAKIILRSVAQSNPNDSNGSYKREHSGTIKCVDTSNMNLTGAHYNGLHAYHTKCCFQFPNIQKQRSEKGKTSNASGLYSVTTIKDVQLATCLQEDSQIHPYASSPSCWISGSEYNMAKVTAITEATESAIHERQTFKYILSSSQTKLTKRPRATTQIHDRALLTRIRNCDTEPNHTAKHIGISDRQIFGDAERPPTCMDALVAGMCASLNKKKRTKKKSALFSSGYSSTNEIQQHHKFVLANYQLPSDVACEVIWKNMPTIDALAVQFRQLNITTESRDLAFYEQNALVPYKQQNQIQNGLVHGDGTIIPFQGSFDPIRKQHLRPKVDLDEETNRVWNLLMLDINSHGIDGMDKDKAKWWEEERSVFRGRADSFIARMHLVQGDRRFSKWKGSVLDSVIGVFLTQNVSDHLSSSAFMSLASRFPQKSSSKCRTYHGEGTSIVVNKPQVHIMEPAEDTKWDEKILNLSVYDQSSMTMDSVEHSEEKAVNSNDSCRTTNSVISLTGESNCKVLEPSQRNIREHHSPMKSGPISTVTEEGQEKSCYESARKESNEIVSSQCSVISSQISGDFSIDQNPEKIGSCSDSNSEVEDLSSTAKYNIFCNKTSFSKLLEMANSTMLHEVNSHRSNSTENLRDTYGQSIGMKHDKPTENSEKSNVIQGSFEASIIPCHENNMNRPSIQTTESPSQVAITHSQSMVSQLHPQEQSNHTQQNFFNISGQTQDLMQKARELKFGDHKDALRNETNDINSAPIKIQSKGQQKEKKDTFNWDSLRIKAQAKAGTRERTEETMDSLDWDTVRRADVSEVADTIKERGMNNRLAERIKNFLNRLVEEHGNTDLEWLRDVPPDQAKEYLLSIRGLGLKSVECVRLLTLHHLAFPVDTNVGRIAVRLGWVPLRPLPESLQLHLLELYPVLESIQKYLWPRLCKLDQRTLYELHYQMITFGKVFCTKSKPNCNACPMRGECRHFASAFASARLALPGPEQRSIVSTAGNNVTDQKPSVIISQLPLPLPENTNQAEEIQQAEVSRQLEAKSEINICQPIIEEPTTPEPECSQVSQNDIEDAFYEDSCEIPTIKLNIEEFTLNLQNYMQENMELQEGEMSKALVALNPEAASIPMPKLKNVSRLRTEHCVYELPDSHHLLKGWDKREPDDPGKYLLAIWTPGETANSIQPPESKCSSQECGQLCNQKECFSCNSFREANSQIVRGTILIPCRTAMRGSFPLNGTYFQVNEVFADHDSSLNPISVPRSWIWNLNRRTVYFGTSVPTIFKGLSTQEIQQCFWRGYVCVRGFDRETRAPRPLMARLHFPASKLAKTKDKTRKESTSANSQGSKPNPEHPESSSNSHNVQERGVA